MGFKDAEFLSRPLLVLDTETPPAAAGSQIPKLVCCSVSAAASFTSAPSSPRLYHHSDDALKGLVFDAFERAAAGRLVLAGQNFAYDCGVFARKWPALLPVIFAAHEAKMIVDTMTAAKFLDNFHGKLFDDSKRQSYSLATIIRKLFNEVLDKGDDGWRLRFGELYNVSLPHWPERAVAYAKGDAIWTIRALQRQVEIARELERQHQLAYSIFWNLPFQAYKLWAARLSTAWGVHTDPVKTSEIEYSASVRAAKANAILKDHGLLKVYETAGTKKNPRVLGQVQVDAKTGMPKKNLKAVQARLENHLRATGRLESYPKTREGDWSLADENLSSLEYEAIPGNKDSRTTGDAGLDAFMELQDVQKTITTWVPLLRRGVTEPIHARVDEFKSTGRLSYFDPNLTQLPRKGGVREAFIPRKGNIFCSIDYDGAEMRAWAQVCWWLLGPGKSPMAHFFRQDPKGDAHAKLAGAMLGITYEEALKRKKIKGDVVAEYRQNAKPANFGFLANMGAPRFVESQRKADPPVFFTEEQAATFKTAFKKLWGAQAYFDLIQRKMGWDETVRMKTLGSNRYRGGCTYTRLANGFFQSLVADGAGEAFCQIVKRQYTDRLWAGYGTRILVFVHDESFSELPEDGAHEAAMAITELQVACLQRWCPDVPITAEPALMRRWYKGAEAVWEQGRLGIWEPKPAPLVAA